LPRPFERDGPRGEQHARLALEVTGLRQRRALPHAGSQPLVVRKPRAVARGLCGDQRWSPQRVPWQKPDKLSVLPGGDAVRLREMRRPELPEPRAAQVALHAIVIRIDDEFAQRRVVGRPVREPTQHAAMV
jgi:hypothetical protein